MANDSAPISGIEDVGLDIRPGSLEPDAFWINDVKLIIPPSAIAIKKDTFNKTYTTLRTPNPQKVKSGYGLLTIGIETIFEGSDSINDELARVVAGLRATPFCVVKNHYLDQQLRTVEHFGSQSGAFAQYAEFRPIVLAMTNMDFSTVEGRPTCVLARFSFIWFNYFPYTPIWSYKTGNNLERPGLVENSALWKAFYRPFLEESVPVNWPHELKTRPTLLRYREFSILPKGNTVANQAIRELLNILQQKPEKLFNAYHDIVRGEDVSVTTANLYDVLLKKLAREDQDINNRVRQIVGIDDLPAETITLVAKNTISPLIERLGKYYYQSYGGDAQKLINNHQSEITQAVQTINHNIDLSKQSQDFKQVNRSDGFQKLEELDINAEFKSASGRGVPPGGMNVFGRKNTVPITADRDMIIVSINVSFENELAIIPLSGYRYPTCQHVGSIDAKVSMNINCSNYAASVLQQHWDRIESVALRFKQIPQGFLNLWLLNDFVNLFGLKEFITSSISTETISGQPGRTMVRLGLEDAGVKSSTRINESLDQEFVRGANGVFRAIDNALGRFVSNRAGVENDAPTETGYYFLQKTGRKNRGQDQALNELLDRYIEIYNNFLEELHSEIYKGNSVEGEALAGLILSLEQTTPGIGYIPLLNRIQKSINDRNKAYRQSNQPNRTRNASIISREQLARTIQKAQLAKDKLQINTDRDVKAQEILATRASSLRSSGFLDYAREMRALFDDIQNNYIDLEEFNKAANSIEQLGIGKGITSYGDFREQIKSVISEIDQNAVITEAKLLEYEPDVYMWYPSINGAFSGSDLNTLASPELINRAKELSIRSWENAQGDQGQVNQFFINSYKARLQSDTVPGPLKELEKYLKDTDGKLQQPWLHQKSWTNALKHEGPDNQIVKSVIPDADQHVHTNFPTKDRLTTNNLCQHTTDVYDLWGGFIAGSNPTTSSTYLNPNQPGEQSYPSPLGDDPKLNEVRPEFVQKIKLIFADLRREGFSPMIHNAYRTPERQAELGQKGTTSHEGPGQHTWGLAADIVDSRYGWPTPIVKAYVKDRNNLQNRQKMVLITDFYKALGRISRKYGVVWGGLFRDSNTSDTQTEASGYRDFGIPGWDPLHIQMYPKGKAEQLGLNIDFRGGQTVLQNRTMPISKDVTTTVSSPLALAIQEMENDILNGQGQALRRAYPTFKLYFIEDDSGERRMAFDDFFSYSSVRSIRVIRSRHIAADLCVLELTNISGILSNRKFTQESDGGLRPRTASGKSAEESRAAFLADTVDENPLASLLLQEGININLRLGYSSDPDLLETVFNGVITEVGFSDTDDLVTVVAQSHAIELVQDIKGFDKPKEEQSYGLFGWDFWGFKQNASTARILEEMISCPEVLHFGRWTADSDRRTYNRELLTNKWQFTPNPNDDNIFAPPPEADLSLDGSIIFNSLKYIIYRTTIWDIFQEMTMRHPNFIASPVPYRGRATERMTMFFGLPNQLYFARDPKPEEQRAQSAMQRQQKELQKKVVNINSGLGFIAAAPQAINTSSGIGFLAREVKNKSQNLSRQIQELDNRRLAAAKFSGYIKPFRRYHLITGNNHIISNNIQANSRDVANTVVIKYGEQVEIDTEDQFSDVAIKGEEQTFTLKLDVALPTEEIRTQMGQFINVTGPELAKRYALSLLARNMRDIYKGELTILGNPNIKPYDVCYLLDEYNDMVGPIEVEEVVHSFDQSGGFVTSIKPDMLVQAAEWSLLTSAEACSIIAEGIGRKVFGESYVSQKGIIGWLTPSAATVGMAGSFFGGFMAQKILNYTQLAQPVVMSPLLYKNRVFAGGVPTRKLPTSLWSTILGEWNPVVSAGFDAWWDDFTDNIQDGLKTVTGGFTQGTFWKNDNTLDVR